MYLQQDYDNNHAADGSLKKNWGTSNIFNIVSSGDVIPRILPAEWSFYRNGNDRFLPSTVIPEELQALNDRSAGMEGTPMDFGRLAVSEETDAVLRSMLDLFCDRQTYYKGYEDAMRCMLQCATTRTEEEVTRGIVVSGCSSKHRPTASIGMTICCACSGTALPSFSSTGRLSAEAACTQRSSFSGDPGHRA